MPYPRLLLVAIAVVACCLASSADPPKGLDPVPGPPVPGLVGLCGVEFANGVVEACQVTAEGKVSVVEPLRSSGGKADMRGGSFVLVCDDDRVERWTPVGRRMVVEHWFPAVQFPAGVPTLGIAELAP